MTDRHRGNRRRSRFGNVAAIEQRDQLAGGMVEKNDRRLMGRKPARVVGVIHGHQLRAHRPFVVHRCRHDAEIVLVCADLEHRAHGLRDAPGRERRQRAFHGVDQLGHLQRRSNVSLGQ